MSYEKPIGFGVDPNKPKGPLRPLTPQELSYFDRMGVKPIFLDLKTHMQEDNREPEPKIFFRSASDFAHARHLIQSAKNAFLIPGQIYDDKNPLTSILLDQVVNGFPLATLDNEGNSLRYRFELDVKSGRQTQGDFNEKSGIKNSANLHGLTDRYERELEQRPGEALQSAYEAFQRKYRRRKDPAFCDGIPFADQTVACGYQAARNELGVAFRHPHHDIMFVFEPCEDYWHTLQPDMMQVMSRHYEFEFEIKQVWGQLPEGITPGEGFKRFAHESMIMFRDYIHLNTPHSTINMKSKAEITKEHLEIAYGFGHSTLEEQGLTNAFANSMPTGYNGDFTALQYALMFGESLETTMRLSQASIYRNAISLWNEKELYKTDAPRPSSSSIGHGVSLIRPANDNLTFSATSVPTPFYK